MICTVRAIVPAGNSTSILPEKRKQTRLSLQDLRILRASQFHCEIAEIRPFSPLHQEIRPEKRMGETVWRTELDSNLEYLSLAKVC